MSSAPSTHIPLSLDNAKTDEDDDFPNDMDEVVPNLWVGNYRSAMDTETLKAKGVKCVVSAMRGRVRVDKASKRITEFEERRN